LEGSKAPPLPEPTVTDQREVMGEGDKLAYGLVWKVVSRKIIE